MSKGPLGRGADSSLSTATGAMRGCLALATPKASCCVKGLASYIMGTRVGGPSRRPVSPKPSLLAGSLWLSISQVTLLGNPIHFFSKEAEQGEQGGPVSVPLQLCSQPPHPREVQAAALRGAQRAGASLHPHSVP